MGKALGTLATIAVAVFAPYAAAALGLSGFAATAFSFVLQAAASSVFGPKAGGGGGRGVTDSGFMVNKGSNVSSIPVVYGDRRMGGIRAYVQTTNNNNPAQTSGTQYLHVILAVAQGATTSQTNAIEDITAVQFNNTEVWSGSVKGQSGSIAGSFSGKLCLRMWLGAHDQTSASDNDAGTSFKVGAAFNKSEEWTTNHNMKGIAYIYAIMEYDRDLFPGAPTITCDIKGKKIKAVNEGGTGVHPTTYVSTDAERKNPANIIYDYLVEPVYGKGINTSQIDIESFKTARTWANGSAGVSFNGALDTADTLFNNTQKLLTSANMNLVYANGKYQLKPVKAESFSSAYDFNKDNILGKVTMSLGNKKNRFNRMKVNYFNPSLEWQPDSKLVENPTYLTEDGGVVNETTIELPMIGDATLAQKIATYYLNASRYQTIMQFKSSHESLKLNVGDPVTVTHDVYGFTDKKFRVNSITLNPDSTVEIVLEEYGVDSIYLENA
jgi:hypothetical protein